MIESENNSARLGLDCGLDWVALGFGLISGPWFIFAMSVADVAIFV